MTNLELKQARAELELTQKQLAAKLFVTLDCVAKWESGKYPIPKHVPVLIKVAQHEKVRKLGQVRKAQ
jgi:DNA-binding transcriptional regulator YiaG